MISQCEVRHDGLLKWYYFLFLLPHNQIKTIAKAFFNNFLTANTSFFYLCAGVSLLRPAPLELPQGGNTARVES